MAANEEKTARKILVLLRRRLSTLMTAVFADSFYLFAHAAVGAAHLLAIDAQPSVA